MNREILFKGLRVDGGGWIQGDYLTVGGNNIIVTENTEYEPAVLYTKVIPETVGQFTGLTDKNGTKIFEGDVLSSAAFPQYQQKVIFHDGSFKIENKGMEDWPSTIYQSWVSDNRKIITSNIHETK